MQCNVMHGHVARYCPNKHGKSVEASGRGEPPAKVFAAVTSRKQSWNARLPDENWTRKSSC